MLGTPISYQAQEKRNIEMLTWIRGFAALIVVVSHIVRGACESYGGDAFDYETGMPYWLKVFSMGNFGVTLFFALSGCTLYLGYNRISTGKSIEAFYLRRFARIYPAFVVSLLAYMAFRPLFQALYPVAKGFWIEKQFLADYGVFQFLQYLTLTFNFRLESSIFNNAYWSLPVEFQFYLLFPLLLALHRRFSFAGVVVGCALAYVASVIFKLKDFHTLGMVWQFGGGMLCGHLFLRKPLRIHWALGLALLVPLHLLAVYIQFHNVPEFRAIYKGSYLGTIAILMVYICVNMDVPHLRNGFGRFLSWQGDVSYSMYLYHNLFVGAWVLLALHWQILGWERVMFVGAGVLMSTYLISHISHVWVEKPGMDWGKRLARRIENKAGEQAKAAVATNGNNA